MTMISTFLSWAERNEYINSNPLAGLVIKRSQNRQNRDSFNRDDLQLIFSQPRFREGKYKNTWEFWLPLLALYTGSRIGELCQLRGTDLVSKNEVLYFDIHSSDGNDLKTANSTRKIPIHTVLRDLGIMDLAKTRGRDFLFDLTPINGKRSHYPSKQFSAFKQKLGFSAKKAFHSFRHTFRDALSEADVRDSLVIALLGHAEESITFSTYGSDASLEQLNRAIQKLDFSDCHHSITTK
jgi:integrase